MAKSKPNANTRAARRAASPSLELDRSLRSAPRAESPTAERPSVLAERRTSGIQKKQKGKKMTRAQRLRQQKGMDRAEAVLDQLEIKKAKSVGRAKSVKERSADWEALNTKASAFAAIQKDNEEYDDEDDDDMDAETEPMKSKPNPFVSQSTNAGLEDPAPTDDYDEIT
ncbi:uncharacterized protein N7483_010254 [Penicillium malachiteum]|uniref:uncharacterized protein n=1 Tax=Penicillium malachiteum TaxID=1324776 RepID=UPI002549563A|nr:uncharacterized protein N7483_010254 [Penicillium malachiteum]KAJ5713073.1 hypothetical protein N7483_010254 [Penicillium malachiteum]